jgi:uncharacterized protein YecE (DUF72 family)
VQPQPVDDELRALAASLPRNLRLGTSSWSFPGWRGLVYTEASPKGKLASEGLAAYAQHPLLRSVGIDRTFYAPIGEATFAGYAAVVPDDFRFLVKAWSDVTSPTREHPKPGPSPHHLDASVARDRVLGPALAGLGGKLGVVLFQFPPQGDAATSAPERFAERLQTFFAALRSEAPNAPLAVELRDPSLLHPATVAALQSCGVQHCFAIHAAMPGLLRQRDLVPLATTPNGPLTIRWMLQPGLRYQQAQQRFDPFDQLAAPDPHSRSAIADLIVAAMPLGKEILVVANNKAEGSAPHSVVELAREVQSRLAASAATPAAHATVSPPPTSG